ncbi:MAG TPA: hypothetical protein VEY09_00715 [Pyrinomonadaceae bacterium]|nr:hypothetical protein [Pyrinomonadaceae bacterium]
MKARAIARLLTAAFLILTLSPIIERDTQAQALRCSSFVYRIDTYNIGGIQVVIMDSISVCNFEGIESICSTTTYLFVDGWNYYGYTTAPSCL